MYNEWISKVWEIIDIGAGLEVIKKSGAFYSYAETKLGQWRENAKLFLKENPELAWEIEEVIKNSI
jgi:recombination protein RecA